MDISTLSDRLNIIKSSMYRFLSVLNDLGYVEKDDLTKKYYTTLKLFQLGALVRNKQFSFNLVRPYLEKLGKKYGETVNLGLFIEGKVVVIDRIESSNTLKTDFGVGTSLPAYCTAMGKLFLADMPEVALEKYFNDHDLQVISKRTITSPETLRKNLNTIREQGFSIDDREYNDDIRCISAPIRDGFGNIVAAISISVPITRFTLEKLRSLVQPFLVITEKISRKIGFMLGKENNPVLTGS